MKNMHLMILLGFALIVTGCQSDDIDNRPPLMDTNSFSNFQPMEMTNSSLTNSSLECITNVECITLSSLECKVSL